MQIQNTPQDPDLIHYRNKYGKVAKLSVGDITVYIRALRFGEWVGLVRDTKFKVNSKGKTKYEIPDKTTAQYILPCVLKPQPIPKAIIERPLSVNTIVDAVVGITDFDNNEALIKKYTKALGKQQLIAMEIKRRLVATYGIEVLDRIENATVDDVMDMIAMGEWITQNPGDFGITLGYPKLLPRTSKGAVDPKRAEPVLNSWLYELEDDKEEMKEPPPIPKDKDFERKFVPVTNPQPTPEEPPKIETPVQEKKKNITISDVEHIKHEKIHKKQDLDKLREPKIYDPNPDTMNPMIVKRSHKEFGGNLIQLWNENSAILYDKIKEDATNPKKIKSFGEIQKEDDKSNVVLGKSKNG